MLLVVDAKINYILNMENNHNYNNEILAVEETTTEKKKCKCCGKELPLSYFKKYAAGYRNICMACQRKENGVSEKFKDFTSRELIDELISRGYKGELKYVETIKL